MEDSEWMISSGPGKHKKSRAATKAEVRKQKKKKKDSNEQKMSTKGDQAHKSSNGKEKKKTQNEEGNGVKRTEKNSKEKLTLQVVQGELRRISSVYGSDSTNKLNVVADLLIENFSHVKVPPQEKLLEEPFHKRVECPMSSVKNKEALSAIDNFILNEVEDDVALNFLENIYHLIMKKREDSEDTVGLELLLQVLIEAKGFGTYQNLFLDLKSEVFAKIVLNFDSLKAEHVNSEEKPEKAEEKGVKMVQFYLWACGQCMRGTPGAQSNAHHIFVIYILPFLAAENVNIAMEVLQWGEKALEFSANIPINPRLFGFLLGFYAHVRSWAHEKNPLFHRLSVIYTKLKKQCLRGRSDHAYFPALFQFLNHKNDWVRQESQNEVVGLLNNGNKHVVKMWKDAVKADRQRYEFQRTKYMLILLNLLWKTLKPEGRGLAIAVASELLKFYDEELLKDEDLAAEEVARRRSNSRAKGKKIERLSERQIEELKINSYYASELIRRKDYLWNIVFLTLGFSAFLFVVALYILCSFLDFSEPFCLLFTPLDLFKK